MRSTKSILVYGRDPRLLETRSLLLTRAGYFVLSALASSDVPGALPPGPFDLLLLCHSLTEEDCAGVPAFAQARWPECRTLVLLAGLSGCKGAQADAFIYATEGPAKLLQIVNKLIGHTGSSQGTV